MKITNQSTLTSTITPEGGESEEVETKSNESNTEYMTTSFTKVKTANKTVVKPEEEIEYTITLTNESDFDIIDMSIKDTMSADATFVTGSVNIDGSSFEDYDPATGFNLPTLAAGNSTVIKYNATVVEAPVGNTVSNTATVTYSVNEVTDLQENTNDLSLPIANNSVSLTKTSDKSAVISGQTLTYQIVIENTGNLVNTNLMFKDPLPAGVQFVAGSVKVDDVEQADADPSAGFALADLNPGDKVVVTFDVTVS